MFKVATVTRPYRMIALLWFLKQSEVTKVEVAPEVSGR